jgi:hypothetical protein
MKRDPRNHTKPARIVIFAVNASLLPGESLAVVRAQAEQSGGTIHELAVESKETVPELPWLTQITFNVA